MIVVPVGVERCGATPKIKLVLQNEARPSWRFLPYSPPFFSRQQTRRESAEIWKKYGIDCLPHVRMLMKQRSNGLAVASPVLFYGVLGSILCGDALCSRPRDINAVGAFRLRGVEKRPDFWSTATSGPPRVNLEEARHSLRVPRACNICPHMRT